MAQEVLSEQDFPATLTIRIDNRRPVELADMANSFQAVASQYRRYTATTDNPAAPDIRLFVKEVRSGSIIAELAPLVVVAGGLFVQQGSVIIEQIKTVKEFTEYLKTGLGFFLGKAEKPTYLNAKDCRDLSTIVNPIVKDNASQLNISVQSGGTVNVFNINSNEANAIQNRVARELELMKVPTQTEYQHVAMRWQVASRDRKAMRGDKVVIEKITSFPLRVYADEAIKAKMIAGEENPFLVGFIVDVEVITIEDRPVGYKVTKFHDIITNEGEQGALPGV